MGTHDQRIPRPERICAGCRKRGPAHALIRLVRSGDGLLPDLTRRHPGRGVHLCPKPACLSAAIKRRALQRTLRHGFSADEPALREAISRALLERLRGLAVGRLRSSEDGARRALQQAVCALDQAGGHLDPSGAMEALFSHTPGDPRMSWLWEAWCRFTTHGTGDSNRPLPTADNDMEPPLSGGDWS